MKDRFAGSTIKDVLSSPKHRRRTVKAEARVHGQEFAIAQVRPLTHLINCNVPHPAAMQRAFGFAQLLKSWYVLFFQIPGLPERLLGRQQARPGLLPEARTAGLR